MADAPTWSEIQKLERLGQGGFGTVYKANWKGKVVAVKELFCSDMNDIEYQAFRKEVEILRFVFSSSSSSSSSSSLLKRLPSRKQSLRLTGTGMNEWMTE
jgi:serine/threonine protein kinase